MLKIVAVNYLIPEKKEEYIQTAAALIKGSNMEAGCISYALYQDVKDPNVVTFLEEWKDQAAIDFHNQTEHFTSIVPKLHDFCAKPGDVRIYELID